MAEQNSNRVYYIIGLFAVAALVLLWKAADIQLFDNAMRDRGSLGMGRQIKYPARGLMYDRDDRLLVENEPIYDLMVTYAQVNWEEFDTTKFCHLLGINSDQFNKAINKDWRDSRYNKKAPFAFMTNISATQFTGFQESLYQFPGFNAELRHARAYPHGSAAHALGFIGVVNAKTLQDSFYIDSKSDTVSIYGNRDYVGKSGLERTYEYFLRGEKGIQLVLKDNLGRVYDAIDGGKDAVGGLDLLTTLDLELQAYAEELLHNKIGSVVAIEPTTGEVLAMVSAPYYDLNLLTIGRRERGQAYQALQESDIQPLINRTVNGTYPPGSPFKTLVSLIGMQEGILDPNRTVRCMGGYQIGGKILTGCHGHPTCTNVEMAIQHSCNAYFVAIFREIIDQYDEDSPVKGLNTFNRYLKQFGLGRRLGSDIPGELSGNVPSSDFYSNVYKKESKWSSAWVRSLGIGQGELLMTNLQMANLAAAIANKGYYITPHLVSAFRNENGQTEPTDLSFDRHETGIDAKHFTPVINGMEKVTLAGTGRMAAIPNISVCGKTGTAENNQRGGEDHSIFFAFAPKEEPKIAIAVYIENGGWGGTYAAPITGLLIEKYLNDTISDNRQWLQQRMLDANLIKQP